MRSNKLKSIAFNQEIVVECPYFSIARTYEAKGKI